MSPRVTLYGRPGCHLCEDALAVIDRVCAEVGATYEEVDITTSAELSERFGEQVPVTFVDGAQHDFWHVHEERLRSALGQGPGAVPQ